MLLDNPNKHFFKKSDKYLDFIHLWNILLWHIQQVYSASHKKGPESLGSALQHQDYYMYNHVSHSILHMTQNGYNKSNGKEF